MTDGIFWVKGEGGVMRALYHRMIFVRSEKTMLITAEYQPDCPMTAIRATHKFAIADNNYCGLLMFVVDT